MMRAWLKLPGWVRFCGAALLVLGAAGWWTGRASMGDRADWVDVSRDDLVLAVEVEGTLKALDSEQLGPPQIQDIWDFKISRLVPEGADVKKGEPVLGFDVSDLERKLEEQSAEAASAQKEIEKREIDLAIKGRDDELRLAEAQARRRKAALKVDRPGELGSAIELRQARLDLEVADKEIAYLTGRMASDRRAGDAELGTLRQKRDRAAQKVREIEDAIRAMTLLAPSNGTVVYVSNWRDEKKKVGDTCWRGEKVLEIPDLGRMKAVGEVDEADAGRLLTRQRVTLQLDAHPDVEFTGTVKSIWGAVQKKSWRNPQKVVRLDIGLDRTDTQRMRPGMRFRGKIETGRVPGALLIPAEAVFPTPAGPIAYRRTRLGYENVRLVLGQRNDKFVEVREGLTAGDRVSRSRLAAAKDAS